jgi:hypothetical protein
VDGKAPRLQFEHDSKINDARFRYSQHHKIDALHSLAQLKQDTTLTRYYPHNERAEACRDRYVFVPRALPRQEPNELHHSGLEQMKTVIFFSKFYFSIYSAIEVYFIDVKSNHLISIDIFLFNIQSNDVKRRQMV